MMNYFISIIILLSVYKLAEPVCHCTHSCSTNLPCKSCKPDWFGTYCQKQNIARGKYANQSSTEGTEYGAQLAVDGNIHENCSMAVNDTTTGGNWTVYLSSSKTYNISQVKVFLTGDAANKNQILSVHVDGQMCFKSHGPVADKEAEINKTCDSIQPGKTLSVNVDRGYLALCEVQVFVCSDGWFGSDCDKQCQCINPSEVCDKDTGYCKSGCTAGKQGQGCQQDCDDLSFGIGCSKTCQCYNNALCRKANGACPKGCIAGKKGPDCQQDCTKGTFGPGCKKVCHCLNDKENCDKKTGNCTSGCAAGKYGPDCQLDCTKGTFGPGCKKVCHCLNDKENCDKKTGNCTSGCAAGKYGPDCQLDCKNGNFGSGCEETCQCFHQTEACDKGTGQCTSGCTAGKHGPNCQKDCLQGKYGLNCSLTCGNCGGDQKCDPKNGHCLQGCKPGLLGPLCVQECDDYTYGDNCSKLCSCLNQCEVCKKVTGVCHTGYQTTVTTSVLYGTTVNGEGYRQSNSINKDGIDVPLVIVGCVLAIACITILVLIGIIIRMKRNFKQQIIKNEELYMSPTGRPETRIYADMSDVSDSNPYVNTSMVTNMTAS